MWLKAQNEMAGLWPHAAMGPVERMVRPQLTQRAVQMLRHRVICTLDEMRSFQRFPH
jgi:hypothetical protein